MTNVVHPYVTGGAQKRVHEIGTRLAADGHEVTVYCRHFWDGPRERRHNGMTLRAVAPEADLYGPGGRRSITEAVGFATRLVPTLRKELHHHDLVVASVFPYFPVLSSKLSTLGMDVPLVTTWHEVWGGYWDGYLGFLAPFGKAVERVTATVPQHPIAVSNVTASRLAAIGPSRDRITIVANGIDVERIRTTDPVADGFDVLFAGRLIEDKNVDMLIQAFDSIASKFDVHLGIVGDGPERQSLERLASTTDHSDRITFTGFLEDYSDVLAHMTAARVFASPSTREGFGITYLEAMAAGCTVIGADHPESAAGEVIGEGGFVVPPTVDDLGDALDRALDGRRPPTDPVEVASPYDWDVVAEQAAQAYRAAME